VALERRSSGDHLLDDDEDAKTLKSDFYRRHGARLPTKGVSDDKKVSEGGSTQEKSVLPERISDPF
jgi:hypothetical protein